MYKAYKISGGDLIYVGTTYRELEIRFGEHKRNKKSSANRITTFQDCKIELLEDNISKIDRFLKERYWIEQFKCVNIVKPTQTKIEYKKNTIDKQKEYNIKWRTNNKEYIKTMDKDRKSNNPEVKQYMKTYIKDWIKNRRQKIKLLKELPFYLV